ncbi:MAG: hypothetical protein J6T56_00995, partial [Bacteroidales bacterium]|nr:hypothetical protein [Bacteroidales bacterium]
MKTIVIAFLCVVVCCMTACRTVDYDNPEPIYMDSVDGISLQPINAIEYYVGPLSHEWFVDFTNGEKGIIGYNRSLPEQWRFRARFDTTPAFPLTGHSDTFIERY